ncbi:MAG: ABC transporter ATP-binding protein [Gammaproteobacteria bacterium]|nr:ABC transporter ATP-binding protein [Gammaproteobacteria bacterium]
MANPALSVENISKLYRIGVPEISKETISNPLVRALAKPLANLRKYHSLYSFTEKELSGKDPSKDILWALRDVSFEMNQGDLVGVVGSNGAGKSTLLKVVSRITPPTKGSLRVWGSVSCLLEVGTGFHGELTGRENIYMSGTILGMRKREIAAKFDEIVEFSGVGKFIDTPVKRYSSGMSVRLAFAVMAHLEPDLLIVDEVLAVGDVEFQRKCLNQMGDAGEQGRTVMFVSHNMAAVARLCKRGLFMQGGQLVQDAPIADVVYSYMTAGGASASERTWNDISEAPGDDSCRLHSVKVVSEAGVPTGSVDVGHSVGIQIAFDVLEPGHKLSPYITLVSDAGIDLFSSADSNRQFETVPREVGRYTTVCWIPPEFLAEGTHYTRVVLRAMNRQALVFRESDVVAFNVVDDSNVGFGTSWWEGKPKGVVRPRLDWTYEYTQPSMIIEG